MKAISASNFFALVCFILVSFQIETVSGDDCRTECNNKEFVTECRTAASFPDCQTLKRSECRAACSGEAGSSSAALNGECRSLRSAYDTAVNKTMEECSYLNVSDIRECRNKAVSCASGTNVFQSENAVTNLMTGIMQTRMATGGAAGQTADTCLDISEDEKAAREKSRIDDKIAKLKEQITKDREDANKADEDLKKKRREVEEKMAKIEEEANKAKVQRQTKTQEQANALQKKILDAEKKRRKNSNEISEKQIQIANLAYGHQEINLKFDPARVQSTCDEAINKIKDQKMMTTNSAGQKVPKNLTASQAGQLKKFLQDELNNCVKEQSLKQQAQVKGLVDAKRKLEMEISELTASNNDEQKAIENEKKNLEAMQSIAEGEEAKELEIKLSKLNSLNQSVTDMEESVNSQKDIINTRIKNRNDEIAQLILDKANVRPRYSKVASTVEGSNIAARNFVERCCGRVTTSATRTRFSGAVDGFNDSCTRIAYDVDLRNNSRGSMNRATSGTGR